MSQLKLNSLPSITEQKVSEQVNNQVGKENVCSVFCIVQHLVNLASLITCIFCECIL